MQTTRINENYIITKADNFKIYVEKNLEKGTLTIRNKKGEYDFSFINSKPKTVKTIAKMLLEAGNSFFDREQGALTPLGEKLAELKEKIKKLKWLDDKWN